MPVRTCSAETCVMVLCMNSSVPQKAVTIAIGVIADASRRALARVLSAASEPAGPAPPARSGRPSTVAARRATSGPSSATAISRHITTPSARLAASVPLCPAATPASTTPPTRVSSPRPVRTAPGRARSTAASPRAWPGRSFEGRRAAR